jgi:ABC-type sugar transport system substrate-binding protein
MAFLNLLKQPRFRSAVWLGIFCVAFIVTHTPPPEHRAPPPINDKLMHFMGFTFLTLVTAWRWAPTGKIIPIRMILIWLGGLLIYGAFDELTQPIAGRDCELLDWAADGVGAVLGLTLGAICQKWTVMRHLAAVALVCLLGSACQSKPAEPSPRSTNILVIGRCTDSDSWPVLKAASIAFMRDNKTVNVEVAAPQVESSAQQRDLLATSRSKGAQAVCISPLDPAGIATEIDELVRSGIPVVTFDLDVPQSSRSVYCGPRGSDMGEEAARACSLTLERGSSRMVILLHAGPDREPYGERYRSFKAAIEAVDGAKILRDLDCHASTSEAVRMVSIESQKYPRVGAWVMLDDWAITRTPIEPADWPSKCAVVLCNASNKYCPELRAGRVSALLGFDLRLTITKALQAAHSLSRGPREGRTYDSEVPIEIIMLADLPAWEKRTGSWVEVGP